MIDYVRFSWANDWLWWASWPAN